MGGKGAKLGSGKSWKSVLKFLWESCPGGNPEKGFKGILYILKEEDLAFPVSLLFRRSA